MFTRKFIILLLSLLGLTNINLMAQQSVNVEIVNEQKQLVYAGSFDVKITSKKIVTREKDLYSIDCQGQQHNNYFNLFISNLKWTKGNPKNSLVIKKAWVKDNAKLLQWLIPCVEIKANSNVPVDVKILKNGITTLVMEYAVKIPSGICNDARRTSTNKGEFQLKFKTKGLKAKTREIAEVNSTLGKKHFTSCINEQNDLASINCLKAYLKQFPKGQYFEKAKKRLGYYAGQDYFPKIESLIKPGQEKQVIKACNNFITLFPSFCSSLQRSREYP